MQSALLDISWNKNYQAFSFVLDASMEIQNLFFNLHLLENIQAKYSAGASRTQEANEKRNLRSAFQEEAENIFCELRNSKPQLSKEKCYRTVEKELKDKYPKQKTPAAETIKTGSSHAMTYLERESVSDKNIFSAILKTS